MAFHSWYLLLTWRFQYEFGNICSGNLQSDTILFLNYFEEIFKMAFAWFPSALKYRVFGFTLSIDNCSALNDSNEIAGGFFFTTRRVTKVRYDRKNFFICVTYTPKVLQFQRLQLDWRYRTCQCKSYPHIFKESNET